MNAASVSTLDAGEIAALGVDTNESRAAALPSEAILTLSWPVVLAGPAPDLRSRRSRPRLAHLRVSDRKLGMSNSASVVLDFEVDASDVLLPWIDPLGADALDVSSSIDGLDRHASKAAKAAELDSRPHLRLAATRVAGVPGRGDALASSDFESAEMSSAGERGVVDSYPPASLVLPEPKDRTSSAGDPQSVGARSTSAPEAARGCSNSSISPGASPASSRTATPTSTEGAHE